MNVERVGQHIVGWLRSYLANSGTKGFVVGVSGGIDSALTSTLCALSGKPTLCLEMPIHQPASHVSRAREHISWLEKQHSNVRSQRVDLSPVYDTFKSILPQAEPGSQHDMALVNSRARLRMTTLYYFAGSMSYLVAGTGNKVEDFGVGFYTKYGDGGVDISPIADLMKSEVYSLAEHFGVVKSILEAPPTDGLWEDDRSDEDQIGATYPELEWAMQFDGGEEELSSRQKVVLSIYRDFHRRNRHKMEPIPVCEIPAELKRD